jgi:hypothetical protein
MPAGCTYNPGRRITFGILAVGMIKGGEATACAHLFAHISPEVGLQKKKQNQPPSDW